MYNGVETLEVLAVETAQELTLVFSKSSSRSDHVTQLIDGYHH
jgi:hypothetical protein